MRQSFLAALAALQETGALPRRCDLTNRELVRELDRSPRATSAAPTFGWLSRRFERAVYGRAPVEMAEAREAVSRARSLRGGLSQEGG